LQLQGVPEAEARHFFQQLIVALAYTHRVGIANRDIKVSIWAQHWT
jgi:serine/threonine protein kinase